MTIRSAGVSGRSQLALEVVDDQVRLRPTVVSHDATATPATTATRAGIALDRLCGFGASTRYTV